MYCTVMFFVIIRILLSELRDAYFKEPLHAQKVLALLRLKQSAQRLSEVADVCYNA